MKRIYYTLIILLYTGIIHGQTDQYSVPFNKGQVYVHNVNGVAIEGYNGDEVIISSEKEDKDEEDNERRKGLRNISTADIGEDNTGLGLHIDISDSILLVRQVENLFSCKDITIKIPKSVQVRYENANTSACGLVVKNISTELEVSKNYSSIKLENVTGPMTVKSVYGGIDAVFEKLSQQGSISIYSNYGPVDITLPALSKSNLTLKTSYGEIYSDMDIEIIKKTDGNAFHGRMGSNIQGTTNGGGVELILKSAYADVYVRKAK